MQETAPLLPKAPSKPWPLSIALVLAGIVLWITVTTVLDGSASVNLTTTTYRPPSLRTVRVNVVVHPTTGAFLPHAVLDVPDDDGRATAFATFNDSVAAIGWSQLWLRATNNGSFNAAMFAAGYAEAALTHRRIAEHFTNTFVYFYGNDTIAPARVNAFFARNLAWMRTRIAAATKDDASDDDRRYWQMVAGVLAQLDGLRQGYAAFAAADAPRLTEMDIFFMNSDGDMQDLIAFANHTTAKPTKDKPSKTNFKCSALIRLLPTDLLWGHATWDTYAAMNKMFKHYDLPLPDDKDHRRRISMSSSPGYISSVDDWYLLDSGLAVMETTVGNFNASLESQFVSPNACLTWVRTKVANALATTGPDWAALFRQHNSGTYNNQWMILDLSLFHNGRLRPHGLTLLEQLPGHIKAADVSDVLNRQGYWASYNIPYFPEIYTTSGFALKPGDTWSYTQCSRAKIFARDAPAVQSLDDLKHLMRCVSTNPPRAHRPTRSNHYATDPLSVHDPGRAVAARYDLATDPNTFDLNGAIDAKVTSLRRAHALECDAVLGPTNDDQPTFEWIAAYDTLASHVGHPRVFNFSFATMRHDQHL
ncbi:Aste57867_115 [Aphanomyces stellatus]|uniref:Phospholipase B-like n=1 Tax=Aphanomyces stellatus TaxID=120398 RepID=A0A485K6Y0_9STRA|nr:hypothetical protein As57867_000115 [Aphanomyces stellatus]VFT77341.1 Aste57867_115 [Aphanomyces stellatus]